MDFMQVLVWIKTHLEGPYWVAYVCAAFVAYWNTYKIICVYEEMPAVIKKNNISDFAWAGLFVLLPLIPIVQALWLWFVLNWSWDAQQLYQARQRDARPTQP